MGGNDGVLAACQSSRRLAGDWQLMTLEPGTCCYRAITAFKSEAFETEPQLVVVSSFSEGITTAAKTSRSLVLLPHVHETCSALTTSPDWEQLVDLTFPFENPPLVLARRRGAGPGVAPVCASIQRLIGLMSAEEHDRFRFQIVDTTQAAARACQAADGPAFCITNEHGLQKYELEQVRVLKHMTIWWLPFRHTGRSNHG